MRKLAILRSNEVDPCPFGLPITKACQTVGDEIYHMEIGGNNLAKFEAVTDKKKCPFAKEIVNGKVNCGVEFKEKTGPVGSPLYYRPGNGVMMEGLNTFPNGYYNDNSIDRGYYFGQYSIESIAKRFVELAKQASDEKFPEPTPF